VFVRQTVAQFGGELSIESTVGTGTTMTILLPYLPGKIAEPTEASRRDKYRLPQKYRSFPSELESLEVSSAGAAIADAASAAPSAAQGAGADGAPAAAGKDQKRAYGKLVFEAYQNSKAQFPGSIFAIAVTAEDRVEMFTIKSYERDWNISHEDVSPMHFQATHRGRVEEDELKRPILILKPPQNILEYFDFKEVPEAERGPERFTRMVRDECIRITRTLIATGLEAQIPTLLASAQQFFAASPEFHRTEPFPLELLARQKLSAEQRS
jgi:hypothetical protein